ncbi:ribosomal protein S18-alanine N-acetyltransferase [Pendulispora albinea]|uniref:Ribosomal protein S18-alanine N-acetyltransferase n=1 Tax=Pendulispora albinea TaxID=2741071 RepID=A0ABZ2LX88_9BACT
MHPLRIESMRPGDIADVLAIDAASFESHRATEATLREELARPWSHLWVARADSDRPSAYIIVWHVADELHVLNVATDPASRRRGHARALMERTIEYGRRGDVRLVVLEVRRSNRAAIALYRTLGFFAMALRAGYYSDGEDAIEMMLLLDPGTREILQREDEVRI